MRVRDLIHLLETRCDDHDMEICIRSYVKKKNGHIGEVTGPFDGDLESVYVEHEDEQEYCIIDLPVEFYEYAKECYESECDHPHEDCNHEKESEKKKD